MNGRSGEVDENSTPGQGALSLNPSAVALTIRDRERDLLDRAGENERARFETEPLVVIDDLRVGVGRQNAGDAAVAEVELNRKFRSRNADLFSKPQIDRAGVEGFLSGIGTRESSDRNLSPLDGREDLDVAENHEIKAGRFPAQEHSTRKNLTRTLPLEAGPSCWRVSRSLPPISREDRLGRHVRR